MTSHSVWGYSLPIKEIYWCLTFPMLLVHTPLSSLYPLQRSCSEKLS